MSDPNDLKAAWEASRALTVEIFGESGFGGGFNDAALAEVATSRNYIAALTARIASLEKVLGDVEDELSDIDGHLQGGDDPDFTDSLRLDAIMDDVDRIRTILAGAKADSPNERNHQ